MKQFNYSARTKEGAVIKGKMQAKSKEVVVETLIKKALIVVNVQEELGFSIARLNEINIGGVPLKDKVVFMRQLSTMISAGLPLTQALQILRDQATNPRFKKSIGEILADVEGGTALAKALKKTSGIFDDVTISLISAGEQSGHLTTILKRLAVEMEKKKKLADKTRSAFIYPTIIVVVVIGVLVLMMTVLVPAMKTIYEDAGATLPGITLAMMAMSDFFLKFWWAIGIVFVMIILGLKSYGDTLNGRRFYGKLLLRMPIFGKMMTAIQITQFTRTLSLLLKSGLSITEALRLTSEAQSNIIFKETVLRAKEEVEKGVPLALPISRSEIFPLIISQMIAVGEETGSIDMVLLKMSDYYSDEVDVMTSNLSTIMEPLILVVMGGMIAFIALAVYLPMFNLSTAFGS
jgi:type IV pilus assembly protein PilC